MSTDVIHMRLSELMQIIEHRTTRTASGVYMVNTSIVRLFADVVKGDSDTTNFEALRVWNEYLESARVDND